MRLKTPKFPSDLISSDKALITHANEQFKAQIQRYNSEVVRQKEATVQQKEATVQRAHEIKEISTKKVNFLSLFGYSGLNIIFSSLLIMLTFFKVLIGDLAAQEEARNVEKS